MNEIAIVQATFPDVDEAQRIGRVLVEERLAACCNVLAPCLSVYRWEGGTEEAHEALAQFKTVPARAEAAMARIAELHSYDLPAIERWGAITDASGAEWVRDNTG